MFGVRRVELGLDSLMAMDLRNRMQFAVKARLSVADLLAGQTIDQLVTKILDAVNLSDSTPSASTWEEGSL